MSSVVIDHQGGVDTNNNNNNLKLLKFELVQSLADHEFFYQLEHKKLHQYRLDNSPKPLQATYNTGKQFTSAVLTATNTIHHQQTNTTGSSVVNLSSKLRLGEKAFLTTTTDHDEQQQKGLLSDNTAVEQVEEGFLGENVYYSPGLLYNANTIEEFNNYDKKLLLRTIGLSIYSKIINLEWLKKPNELFKFLLLTFADLKQHSFYSWFAFPSLILPNMEILYENSENLEFNFLQLFEKNLKNFKQVTKKEEFGFYLITENGDVKSLLEFENVSKNGKYYFGFSDPSSLNDYPSSILRNYLVAIYLTFKLDNNINIIAYRQDAPSLLLKNIKITCQNSTNENGNIPASLFREDEISIIGWERNSKNKLGPKFTNMGSSMDPLKLAQSSVSLNLQLMKWRQFPSLDLNKLSTIKCLLIGSGTLGCHVARNLMAWGLFNISMVDRTRVSFSNPVRQPLYEYEDCLGGGKPKAECAVEHLKKIYPLANVHAHSLDIPMPGHFIGGKENSSEKVLGEVRKLEELIEQHDVIYLLTDTRESRWLPSLIGLRRRKIIINAALGFESYLVMRYGVYHESNDTTNTIDNSIEREVNSFKNDGNNNNRLGCYFCNDVVAPVNSTKDRTLDQQCTVTRPGVSAIAGSLAVELLVSLCHHSDYKYANAYNPTNTSNTTSNTTHTTSNSGGAGTGGTGGVESELGLVPHQIRGSISNYQTNLLYGSSYHQCTCCSPIVMEQYIRDDFKFLERCFNDSKYLEELTGLKKLHEETLKLLENFDYSSESSDDDDENENEKKPTYVPSVTSSSGDKQASKEVLLSLSEMSREELIEKIKQLERENEQLKIKGNTGSSVAANNDDDDDGFEML